MNNILIFIAVALLSAAFGIAVFIMVHRMVMKGRKDSILEKAELEAENIKKERILQAKEKFLQLRSEHEKFVNEKNAQIKDTENRLKQKENNLNQQNNELQKKIKDLDNTKASLQSQKDALDRKAEEYESLRQEANKQIESIAGMTANEAKNLLMENMKAEARSEAQAYINDTMDDARLNAAREAKRIVITTIQRTATETAIENAVTTFPIENDDIKGRIIGREGRNIRALEAATGVEIVVDDTPDAILLSAFDPVRREVARLALHQLVVDGRIHPARIEETVEKARVEVENTIREEGEAAVLEVGVHGLNPELIKLLGRMKFRTSYGQNGLKHSIEVAQIAGLLASELGYDVRMAKRAGLLHDIGKAVDHEQEGTHVQLGVELCKKYKEPAIVINAVESHHGDTAPTNPISFLVAAADAISASRPGARRESLEAYTQRLRQLEEITNSYDGVEKSFAVQAGREVRIMVIPSEVSEDDMVILSRDIAKRIEDEMTYPGQIKVNVIRETRATATAK